jgi:ankyrin repeat protein
MLARFAACLTQICSLDVNICWYCNASRFCALRSPQVQEMKDSSDHKVSSKIRNHSYILEMLDIYVSHHGTILLLALRFKSLKVVTLLLTGEYVDEKDSNIVYRTEDSSNLKVKPLSPNTRDAEGECALHIACELGICSIIDELIDYKQGWEAPWLAPVPIPSVETNPNSEDKDKNTPLMIAVMNGHTSVVEKLTTELPVFSSAQEDTNEQAGININQVPMPRCHTHRPSS